MLVKIRCLYKGFSLIELMVVIAIVAILAALAIPSYKNHVAKARVNSEVVPAMTDILDRAMKFADKNGYFPSGQQLGLVNGSCATVSMPKYGTGWGGGANPNSNEACGMGDACGKTFAISLYLNGATLGIPSNLVGVTNVSYYIVKINDVYKTFCFFETGASWSGPWANERYIPNCHNGNSAGISADGGVWAATMPAIFAAATCS